MKKLIILGVLAYLLLGCEEILPEEVKSSSNISYNVAKLFEVDGITVYRFTDNGRYVYFTNRQGKISYDYTVHHGKVISTRRMETLCD